MLAAERIRETLAVKRHQSSERINCMLDNTLTFDYSGSPITLDRVNQDNYSSTYFGEATDAKISLRVSHTIPPRGGSGESHLVRLDVEHYDGDGAYVRTSSAWTVIKTFDNTQDATASEDAASALIAVFGITDLLGDVIGRQS
jgi:hypothetical protein